ncbi:hypothetical protein Bsp3421_001469 [Burkholderia sp. FERM BP-3421]|uniref:AfsA-related hotdog domain-containing protein n=1 Tax=Burkholderia sp. FERM BP-3421 TaxID=1494466 RepID=UPI00235F09E2|nr:AfsA-related hotdog domain-containing protein [Burkholderia sp. FERM BP-3421]WDD91541.1 hypothetical protein Bsp3421_001469 [Burkholderia sp. FERM BP-3421]
MMLHEIPPQLLHKGSADDVLIHRYRPAPPLYLDETAAARIAAHPDAGALADLYRPCDGRRARLDVPLDAHGQFRGDDAALSSRVPADPRWHALRGVPYQVLDARLAGAPLDDAAARLAAAGGDALRWSSAYEMINHADHYYFYRKEHEHVPGVMLIEAQRQAVYCHLYKHTAHQRGRVTVSLNALNSTFHAYAELMYPIELVVDDLAPGPVARPRKIDYRVSFYQRRNLIAVIDTKATVIDMAGFERIRDIFLVSDDWYAPIDAARVQCRVDTDGVRRDAQLLGVSKAGCVTRALDLERGRVHALVVSDPEGVAFEQEVAFDRDLDDGRTLWRFVNSTPDKVIDIGRVVKRGFVASEGAPMF